MSHTSTSLVLFHAEGTSEKHHKPSFTEDENWTGTMKRKKVFDFCVFMEVQNFWAV